MLRIQSTVYPPGRAENKIKDGGLWYSEQQNELLEISKKIITKKRRSDKERFVRKLIIIAIIIDLIALIKIIS